MEQLNFPKQSNASVSLVDDNSITDSPSLTTSDSHTISPHEDNLQQVEFPLIYEPRNAAGYTYMHRNSVRGRRLNQRIIEKVGYDNIIGYKNLFRRKLIRYLKDLVNTIIDSKWHWTLWIFVSSYIINWLFFGTLWMWVGKLHGNNDICYTNTNSFTDFFLLSVETETTIGYGVRSINDDCPGAIILLCLQMLLSISINGAFLGVIYAKMIRPVKCYRTRLFSKCAVISQRDGKFCFMFRVGDLNYSHMINTKISAYFIRNYVTREQEVLNNYFIELKLEPYGFLLWPLTIMHIIDENSPLYDISANDLLTNTFEIVVLLNGISQSTGQQSQIRSSYLSTEILWGHRFVNCTIYDPDRETYVVEHKNFHRTREIDTPLCSVKQFTEFLQDAYTETSC